MSGRYETVGRPSRRVGRPKKTTRPSASPPKKQAGKPTRRASNKSVGWADESSGESIFFATPLTNSPVGDFGPAGTECEPDAPSGVCGTPPVHHGSLRVLTTTKPTDEDAGVMADPVAVIILSVIACMMCAVLIKEMEGVWFGSAAGAAFGRKLSGSKPTESPTVLNGGIEKLVSLARGYMCAWLKYWFGVPL